LVFCIVLSHCNIVITMRENNTILQWERTIQNYNEREQYKISTRENNTNYQWERTIQNINEREQYNNTMR
jgi:hypothetical protein